MECTLDKIGIHLKQWPNRTFMRLRNVLWVTKSFKSVRNIGNINQHSFVILCEPVRWAGPLGRWVGWTIILLHCCLPGVKASACPSSQERHHQPSMDPYSLSPLSRWIHTGVSLPQPALALRKGQERHHQHSMDPSVLCS